MSKSEVRIPRQQRSIEKKEKIVRAGYEIFCEKGYHNTNTAEIAKRAGVATGSVYSYYKDKKSIFMDILDLYSEDIMRGIFKELDKLDTSMDLNILLYNVIQIAIHSHTITREAHEEMLAMSHLDQDVADYFKNFKARLVKQLVFLMGQHGFYPVHAEEKTTLAYHVIEDLCHEIAYFKQESIDYDIMISEAVSMLIYLLTKEDVNKPVK